jgi:hypothetical protein
MIKPKNKQELLKLLSEKTYKISFIEEGKAGVLGDQIKKLNNKVITVIVLE